MPKILDGKALSKVIRADLAARVSQAVASARLPGLGVVLVGENSASKTYVASKEKQAHQCGFYTEQHTLPTTATQQEVAATLQALNESPLIDGILLQLPLPAHLDAAALLTLIDPAKDADGLHTFNQGLLVKGEARSSGAPLPCTPHGAMKLIDFAMSELTEPTVVPEVSLAGLNAVVIGRSILVGRPVALLLLERNATVTIIHSKTKSPEQISATADIIVAASGVPGLVNASWVKQGAVVIDVGINRLADGKIVGDVAYDEVAPLTRAITPVPGGVGPMTVAMLLSNTFTLYQKRMNTTYESR